jgi:hypothetical protein
MNLETRLKMTSTAVAYRLHSQNPGPCLVKKERCPLKQAVVRKPATGKPRLGTSIRSAELQLQTRLELDTSGRCLEKHPENTFPQDQTRTFGIEIPTNKTRIATGDLGPGISNRQPRQPQPEEQKTGPDRPHQLAPAKSISPRISIG